MAAGKLAKWVPVGSLRQPFIYIYIIICIWMVCVLNHFHLAISGCNKFPVYVCAEVTPWLVHPSADADPTVRCCETG